MIKLSFLNLFRRKARTFLALLGVMIGVASIIVLVSIVDGLFDEVNNAIGQVQGIRVLRTGGDPIFSRIDLSFLEKLERINGVSVVVPLVTGPIGSIDGESLFYGNTRITGIDFSKQAQARHSIIPGEIVEGRDLRVGDSGVVVIGESIKKDYGKFLNQSIEVDGEKFRVVGVYSAGSPLLGSNIVMSIGDARNLLGVPSDKVSGFNIELSNPENAQAVVSAINFRFKGELKAFTASDLSEQFGSILGSFRLLVVAVAAISAIVAGVGIINTMLMSVLERFKEIGTLKAVGWSNTNIVQMVLFESVLISFFGALIGVIFGFLFGAAVKALFGLSPLITFPLLFEVFLFAFVLGVIGGAYPSFIASKMDPVDALRAE